MQEGEGEDGIGNGYLYPEEDLQAHSNRDEDFNFSELNKESSFEIDFFAQ